MKHDAESITHEKYPDTFNFGNINLSIEYKFAPLLGDDGATLVLPLAFF